MQILNKLIQSYRTLQLKDESEVAEDEEREFTTSEEHFRKIHVDRNLIQEIISEADLLKNDQADLTGASTLYSRYLQTQVELAVGALLPTGKQERMKSVSDLLQVPRWIESLTQAAQILAFLESSKNTLSEDLAQMCFEATRLNSQWERVIIVSKLPQDWTRKEIEDKITAIIKKNRGIIQDIFIPKGDIKSEKSETKKELQDFYDYQKLVKEVHQRRIDKATTKIQEFKERLEEEKKAKESKEKKEKGKKGLKSEPNTPCKVEDVKTTDEKEEDSKEAPKQSEESEKQQVENKEQQEIKEETKEETKEEVKEEVKEENKDLNWDDFDHQGAVIIFLDEFDLSLLTEEDLKVESEEVEEVKEDEVEIPPELNLYNCAACTLENPMTNETCAICGTPRPADAGQQKKDNDEPEVKVEEEDSTKKIEEKYELAIKNRKERMITEIKDIVPTIVKAEKEEEDKLNQEVQELEKEYNKLVMDQSISPADKDNFTAEKLAKATESLGNVETMGLGNLFDAGEGDGELNKQPAQKPEEEQQPAEGDQKKDEDEKKEDEKKEDEKKEDEKKEDEKKEDEKKEDEKREDEKKEEGVKMDQNDQKQPEGTVEGEKKENLDKNEEEKEQPIEEEKEEKMPNREPREDVKVFFGNTVEDDYKSEKYLEEYLRNLLVTEDGKLTEECKKMQREIINLPDNSDFGIELSMILGDDDLLNLAKEDPKKAWEIFEGQGYDLSYELSAYRTLKELKQNKISKTDQERLLKMITVDICDNCILSPHFKGNGLKLHKSKYHVYELDRDAIEDKYIGLLNKISYRDIRYYWALLRLLNKQLHSSIYLIYCEEASSKTNDLGESFSLPGLLSRFRIIIHNIKFDLKSTVLDKTSISRDKVPEVSFERLKIAHFQHEKGSDIIEVEPLSDEEGLDEMVYQQEESSEDYSSLLYNSYEQLSQIDITQLRPKRPQGAEPHLSFAVVFKGEHVVGEGGPYRQFFADLSAEIQPQAFVPGDKDDAPILVPTPNNVGEVKDYKEYWTINSSCTSTQDLALYEYLGILMGVCVRTNVHLTLDIANICWKPLVGESLTLQDLYEIDVGFIDRLKYILQTEEESFESVIMDTFAVTLSDGSTLELCENGLTIPVTFENKNEYVIKAISARLNEAATQCIAIKNGLSKIIPEGLLNLMTPEELKEAVCGKIKCDLELLKRNTEYGGSDPRELENSNAVKWLWEVLEEISEEDKLKFIVFCWGQERLPANDEEFKQSKTRFMIKPAMNQSYGDGALPRANTCFFNFELPNYSTKEALRERLLLAIRTDNRSMNAEQKELLEHQGRNELFGANNDDDY